MGYYQARLSIETAKLLEKMRLHYEKETGGSVSKGDCLIKAYYDSLWVKDWKDIFKEPTPQEKEFEISPTAQLLKVQLTEEVKKGIQNLKLSLPDIIGTRSVTIGVCIREILKAAYIKRIGNWNESIKIHETKELFNMQKDVINTSFDDEDTQKDILKILENLESEILNILHENN